MDGGFNNDLMGIDAFMLQECTGGGTDGSDGTDGTDGTDGVTDGTDGVTDGTDGTDGGCASTDGLESFTGNAYNWTSYNDSTSGSPVGGVTYDMALNQNGKFVTDFSIDTDYACGGGSNCYWLYSQNSFVASNRSGDMVDYDTGAITTNLTWDLVNPQASNNLWSSTGALASSGARATVFGPTLGTFTGTGYGALRAEQHNASFVANRGSSLTFSGLDNSKTYDFVAEATSSISNLGDMNYTVTTGTGAANAGVATVTGAGYSAGMTSTYADDLVAFTGISPVGGVIEIQLLSIGGSGVTPGGNTGGKDLSVGAFVLGEQCAGGGTDGTDGVTDGTDGVTDGTDGVTDGTDGVTDGAPCPPGP